MSFNCVILQGNVGQDPRITSSNAGNRFANFSLATSEKWKDKSTGEKREKTDWHNIVIRANDGLIGVVEQYVKKGSTILVRGKLENRKYQDQAGNDKFITEVVLDFGGQLTLLGGGNGQGGDGGDARQQGFNQNSGGDSRRPANQQSYGGASNDVDDDIPF